MKLLKLLLLCAIPSLAVAQQWSGVLDPARAVDWSAAGVTGGGIPSAAWANCVTAACNTLFTGTVSIANINAALNSAPANTVVRIRAGTFSVSGTINLPSNVALRGAGANLTRLNWTSAGGCQAGTCLVQSQGTFNDTGAGIFTHPASTTTTWTGTNGNAGVYPKGATILNLRSVTGTPNLQVGDTLFLFQNDDTSPTTGPFICQADGCSREGGTNPGLQQYVRVAAINGTAVTVFPGIYATNWVSGKSPQAYWWGGAIHNSGLEDFTINGGALTNFGSVNFWQTYDCWMRGMGSIETGSRDHVFITLSRNITIQDSFFQNSCTGGCGGGATGYGLETWGASDILRQNNILDNIQASWVFSVAGTGIVDAYNFDHNGGGSVTAMTFHEQGNTYNLAEGNDTNLYRTDTFHGTQPVQTIFRNRISNNGQPSIDLWAYARYYNIVGNVLGSIGFSTYQCLSPNASGTCSRFNNMIYRLGFAGANAGAGPEAGVASDNTVWSSVMRWGNYDTVNSATRFVNAEVPTADPILPNAVPASQTLPASFYLNSKPAWFAASKPWPLIGPDVTGGNISGLSGHAYTTPAQDCYTSIAGNIASFNAATCYASAPAAPAVGLTPLSLSFGNVIVGVTTSPMAVTLTNTGSATLTIASITLTGANAADYAISANSCGGSLAVGLNCSVSVTFTPSVSGSRLANLTFTTNASSSPDSAPLSGTGVTAFTVSLSPTSLAFQSSGLGVTSSAKTVTLTNT